MDLLYIWLRHRHICGKRYRPGPAFVAGQRTGSCGCVAVCPPCSRRGPAAAVGADLTPVALPSYRVKHPADGDQQ